MTSVSIRDRHEFTCDSCGAEKIIFAEDLKEALGAIKQDGWACFKHEEHFHHSCPQCDD